MSKKGRVITAPGCISCGRPTRSASGFCWQHWDMAKYRQLEEGEIIQPGDQVDASNDGWRDEPRWEPANCIGQPAPNPLYPSHRRYRRPTPAPADPCPRCLDSGWILNDGFVKVKCPECQGR